MIRNYLTTVLLVASSIAMSAQQISETAASQLANQFWMNAKSQHAGQFDASTNAPKLAYTASIGNEVQFYVFNNTASDGFVIVGGDESAQQILGYSSTGTFDYDSAPENLKWWLSLYQTQIHEDIVLAKSGVSKTSSAKGAAKNRVSIPNLLTTKWNQDAPFNSMIPNLPGHTGRDAFATGCVPVAMSQIMKMYEYPTHGIGTNEYFRTYGNDTLVFHANFEGTTYDWQNMKDSYAGSYSDEQKNAVGTLIYHAAVSANAEFGAINAGGTSVINNNVPSALVNAFGYDKGMSFLQRKFYNDETWNNTIYSELAAGRPVLYMGSANGAGHAFILHGYNANKDMFYINWGWGGLYDGEFSLVGSNALKPSGSGIGGGGANAAYNEDQEIVIGIRPDVGGEYVWNLNTKYPYTLTHNGEIVDAITVDNSGKGESFQVDFTAFNGSMVAGDFIFGLRFVDENTRQSKVIDNIATAENLAPGAGRGFSRLIDTKTLFEYNGEYAIYPVFRLASAESATEWKRVAYPADMTVPVVTIVGALAPEPIPVDFRISASAMKEETSVDITWNNNYTGDITCSATPSGIVEVSRSGNKIAVLGKNEGTAVVTVAATANGYYLPTEREFEVTVTKVPVVPVSMEISGTEVSVGETLKITCDPEYTGVVTYSCDPEGIVTIDSDGTVHGVSGGSTIITAVAEGIRTAGAHFFTRTVSYFDVTVNDEPKNVYVLDVEVPNNGYFTMKGFNINTKLKNNSGSTFQSMIYCSMTAGNVSIPNGYNIPNFDNGKTADVTFDFPDYYLTTLAYTNDKNVKFTLVQPDMRTQLEPTVKSLFYMTLVDEQTVKCNVGAEGWGTLILPFNATLPSGLKAYNCTEFTDNLMLLTEVEGGRLTMDTPYIIFGTTGSYAFSGPQIPNKLESYSAGVLTGVMEECDAPEEAYLLGVKEGVPGFYKVDVENGQQRVDANTAYIVLPTTGNMNNVFFLTEEDYRNGIISIENATSPVANSGIFTLGGQKLHCNVSTLPAGIYVINGAKVVVGRK